MSVPRRWRRTRRLCLAALCAAAVGCGGKTGLDEPGPAEMPVGVVPSEPELPMLPEGVADLSAGLFHTCAVRAAGDAWCWGFNNSGQLGDGTHENRHAPVRVGGVGHAVLLRAGREHTCALERGGVVRCWGSNRHGQLGSSTDEVWSVAPREVSVPGEVVELSAGGQHTCALTAEGAIACWGDDSAGQLGGVMDPTHRTRFARPDLTAASNVSAGWLHTCAVLRDHGGVRCWGDNHSGQLGRSVEDMVATIEPVVVELPGDAVDVAAGDHHSCAVLSSGEVWCWGANHHGQLGDGAAEPVVGPVRVAVVADAEEVRTGHEHTCALRRGGEVACWGRADRGQLGIVTDLPFVMTPSMGHGLHDVAQISMGWRHGCARRGDGELLCWGRNVEGQLGTGSMAMRQTPTRVALE